MAYASKAPIQISECTMNGESKESDENEDIESETGTVRLRHRYGST